MSYKITFKDSVKNDLKKIDKKQISKILIKIEKELSQKADLYPFLAGKFAGLKKCRIGNYHIIYSFIDDAVLILRIGHRKNVYKKIS